MKILVLFAHPRFSASVVQKAMLAAITGLDGVTIHDLYAAYPDFDIDVPREQKLLLDHDLIVFQHPFYWYSCPAIVKEWLDLVLESGWAYGPDGTKLAGKFMMSAVSTGGSEMAYRAGGRNRFEIRNFFAPFEQTAHLCGMAWLEPFAIFAARRAAAGELTARAEAWRDVIVALRDRRLDPMAMLAEGYTLPAAFAERAA